MFLKPNELRIYEMIGYIRTVIKTIELFVIMTILINALVEQGLTDLVFTITYNGRRDYKYPVSFNSTTSFNYDWNSSTIN